MLGQIILYAGESVWESMFIGGVNGILITIVYFLYRFYQNKKKAKEIVEQLRKSKVKDQDKVVSPPMPNYNEINDNEVFSNLFEELKAKCHPKQFMEPYDHEKVKLANELYARILEAKDYTKRLEELRAEAMEKLGVKFSSKSLYEKLVRVTNPANFMNPYDEEKVAIANDYYQRVQQNAGNVVGLEAIWKEVKENSIFWISDSIISPQYKNGKDEGGLDKDDKLALYVLIIVIIIGFIIIAGHL